MIGASRKFLVAVSQKMSVEEYLALGPIRHLFKNAEVEAFDAFDKHVKQHATIPAPETLPSLLGSDTPKAPEPPSYYMGYLVNRHFENLLTKTVTSANELVQADKSQEAALQIVNALIPEIMRQTGNRLIDFRDSYEQVLANYFHHFKLGADYGINMGWPALDAYGGLVAGDIMSVVGRPSAGKSFLLLRCAHHVWKQQQKPPAFISMEMNNLVTGQRLVAMDVGVPLSSLKLQKGHGLSTAQLKKLKDAAKNASKIETPFHLMDGNLKTTVEDIYNFCRYAKPSVLFVDGAYLLKHPNSRLGRFERVAENCELLKQEIAGNLGIPVVASWQFSRDFAKKQSGKHKGKPGLEDIGYSDAIGQVSSAVLGLLEEESIETLIRKTISIMKGRDGHTGEFQINWKFNPVMDFDQYVEQEASELKFL